MIPSRELDVRWSPPALAGVALVAVSALALAACGGGKPNETGESRVDSAARFEGERREIATTLEAFEQAVLADDVERICGRLVQVRESRDPDNDNGGRRFCTADPANDPARELHRAGGAERYDLIVRRIELNPGLVRSDGHIRRAAARVEIGQQTETFLLGKRNGGWEVTGRSFAKPAPSQGLYELAPGCRSSTSVIVFAGQPKAQVPREAVMRGPFGGGIRRALSRGASLSLAGVEYSPDYRHTYLLRNASGRATRGFPVMVYRFGSFDASEASICNGRGAQRLGRRGPKALTSLLRTKTD